MAVKTQRHATELMVTQYENLVYKLMNELAELDNKKARKYFDESARLKKESIKLGWR